MNESPNTMNDQAPTQYKGVGGWLLLFCLGLTVFGPLITLGKLVYIHIDLPIL